MHNRFSFRLFLFGLFALVSLRAQTPPPAAPASPEAASLTQPGVVLVAKVAGRVTMTLGGVETLLKVDDRVSQAATVTTATDASVVLVFSNGATTQLGSDSELVIEEFLQDPFGATIKVSDLVEEPSPSRTRLALKRGELIGNVKKLKHDRGSSFTVQTPVGAAGIRGTTFRIVFRPQGNGFAFFALSTVEGDVNFQQPGQGTAGTPGAPGTPGGAGTGDGVGVPGGQEVVVTVSVEVNPTTGAVTITVPPQVAATVPISVETQAAVVQQAQAMAVATAAASFTSSSTGGGTTGGTSGTSGSGAGDGSNPGGNNAGGENPNPNSPPDNTPPAAVQNSSRITPGDGGPTN